ncbi:MBL fold metallo-hydrolase [Massilia sp. W12]|uniref:MBL fold metallo-hydrolase n=1 Tax=Massilia sp. W12 TaxID=3126507 RepID=UPI0030CF1D18
MQTAIPQVQAFYESISGSYTYCVHDGRHAAVIDPVLDYDPKSGRTAHTSAQAVLTYLQHNNLQLDWILETHAHADHLSAAQFLRAASGAKVAISRRILGVQRTFRQLLNLQDFAADGADFDQLLDDDAEFAIGSLRAQVLSAPGHTQADSVFLIGDAAFIGDTLFMPDVGSARCDFPGGDARRLYASVQQIYALPPATRLFVCHDYPPAGRAPRCQTSIAEQRAHNIHLHAGVSEAEFVAMREQRDKNLAAPVLLWPSVQVNIRAGHLPAPEANGRAYLKIPLNLFHA